MHASLPLRRHASPIWPLPTHGSPLAAAAHRSQPPPTPDPRSPPGRAGASARRHRAAVRCGTNGRAPTPDPLRTRATPRARRRVRGRASRPHSRTSPRLPRRSPSRTPRPLLLPPPRPRPRLPPWLPSLVLSVLILMLVLVPITLAAAPPPAYHLHAWASLPGVCLAGRGRGVQREAVDPPSSKAQAWSEIWAGGRAAAR